MLPSIAALSLLLWLILAALPGPAWAGCDIEPWGALALGERVRDVERIGNAVYLAAGFDGLHVVDLSAAAHPMLLGTLDARGFAHDVEVVGSLAYVAESNAGASGGLRIVDVSDPAAPSELSRHGSNYTRVAVQGDYAYAIKPNFGLKVLDVSDPANPTPVGAYQLPGFTNDVEVVGNRLYLAVDAYEGSSRMLVMGVANPAAPVELGGTTLDGRLPYAVEIEGDLGFVPAIGGGRRGLAIHDLSDPLVPVELSFLKEPSARHVAVAGNRAFFAFGADVSFGAAPGGLRVIDTTNPDVPVVVGSLDSLGDEFSDIEAWSKPLEDWAVVAVSGTNAGLHVFRISGCPRVMPADVIPSGEPNEIPVTLGAQIQVALLGSASLSVFAADLNTIVFGPAGAAPLVGPGLDPFVEDVNDDGFLDVVFTFLADELGLEADAQQACLQGQMDTGQPVLACDWVVADHPPVAIGLAQGNWRGPTDLRVLFRSIWSFDPEGGPVSSQWRFDEGGEATGSVVERFHLRPGRYGALLTVTDQHGQVASTRITVNVTGPMPAPALSPWMLTGLAGLLTGVGARLLRRPRPA